MTILEDGSFVILVTFLVDAELAPSGEAIVNDCPEDCDLCQKGLPDPCDLGVSQARLHALHPLQQPALRAGRAGGDLG